MLPLLALGAIGAGTAGMGALGGVLGKNNVTLRDPWNQKAVGKLFSRYLQSRIGKGMTPYGGQFTAGMSPWEQRSTNILGNYMGGVGQYMPQRQAAYGRAVGGQALSPIDMQASKDWFKQEVVPQYQKGFSQMAAPALEQAKAMGARASSSGMNAALAGQSAGLGRYLGDLGYERMLQEEQAKRSRDEMNLAYQWQAANSAEPLRAEQLQQIHAGQQYGALPRLIEQASLDADFQEWLRTQPEYSPVLQQALSFLGLGGMSYSSEPNTWSQVLSGMGAGMGGGGQFMGGLGQFLQGMG